MGRFQEALRGPDLSFIAEFKRSSPSAGPLRPAADPAQLVPALANAGAAAVSVLVDARFGGRLADLETARAVSSVPLLAKGFFTAPRELDELKAAGADAVLLLLRDLSDLEAAQLLAYADRIGVDTLVEAHDATELARAVRLSAPVVGVNARDLDTFAIDRSRQLELVAQVPDDRLVVAESGISSRAQAALAELAGANAVLVGSELMRASDPAARLQELAARPLVKICGLTRQEDVDGAVAAGADLVGFIFAPSPRQATQILSVPDTVLAVAVFVGVVDADLAQGADLTQLYPQVGLTRDQDAVLLLAGRPVAQVLDLPWESPVSAAVSAEQLHRAAQTSGRVMLAGRLGPDNIGAAITATRPWAVDAASRLERSPGVKDPELVQAFIASARAAGAFAA
jgi:indole-3-glycerol phosphate synthase/phosphoribosylanthranilate isomerase